MVRFADDFVGCFQLQADAQIFQHLLRERFARFNLELAEEKTRMLLFGRFAGGDAAQHAHGGQEHLNFLASNTSVGRIGKGASPDPNPQHKEL